MKHGASYRGGGNRHNKSLGATQPKSGDQFTPICRAKGYNETMGAMGSKTRSQYPHTGKHYQYEGCGEGTGGNVIGWSPE